MPPDDAASSSQRADSEPAEAAVGVGASPVVVHFLPLTWCLIIAAMSIFPGSLGTSPCCAPLLIPLAFLASAIYWLRSIFTRDGMSPSALLWTLAVLLILGGGFGGLFAGMAFSPLRGRFEQAAADAPPPGVWAKGGPSIGIYDVKQILSDHQGGTYFVTNQSFELFSTSYSGFAWRAHEYGGAFGHVKVSLTSIGNDWSLFWVSWTM